MSCLLMNRSIVLSSMAASAMLTAGEFAEAQVVRAWRGGGVIVSAPGVNVRVGPVGIPGRPYVLPRRRFAPTTVVAPGQVGPYVSGGAYRRGYYGTGAQVEVGPTATPPVRYPETQYQSTPTAAANPLDDPADYPTAYQLRQMDDSTLLNSLIDLTMRLDERLGGFNTGAGWQRLLRLPDDALPPPSADDRVTLGMSSLQATLAQFDGVARQRQYDVISQLPAFVATHAALREVVGRFGGRRTDGQPVPGERDRAANSPVDGPQLPSIESLPPPEPISPTSQTRSFDGRVPRSILKR